MSDSGEKKHPASAKKLRDQRKKGQVSQSQDVSKLLALTAISEVALFTAETSLLRFQQLMVLPMSRLSLPFVRALEEVLIEGLVMFFSFSLLMAGLAIAAKLILQQDKVQQQNTDPRQALDRRRQGTYLQLLAIDTQQRNAELQQQQHCNKGRSVKHHVHESVTQQPHKYAHALRGG